MKIGILGSGVVGQTLGIGLMGQGHEVTIGTRDSGKLNEWLLKAGSKASVGSFYDAAKFGEVIFIATVWTGTENAINLAGKENFAGKIVVDVTNPLDFSKGTPAPAVSYPLSASEQIQNWLPAAKVVKAFNIVPAHVQVTPKSLGDADLFIAGNHKDAKEFVRETAKRWGWSDVIDMGDIKAAYWVEMLGLAVINYGFKHNDWNFALKLLRK
ncbi:MAG: NAD(P)-binding domain-containing protein [Candidatus Aenigmarchaeota archaeon]|nr:NAD(P)-binding domain-containing protein [Candidatus Aenigmarchaeota archaeon]